MLTSYNTLADFVPNLDICERVSGAPPGKQRLRQRACSQSLYWRLQAEAILDVQKVIRTRDRRELHFTMVEGDFQVHFLQGIDAAFCPSSEAFRRLLTRVGKNGKECLSIWQGLNFVLERDCIDLIKQLSGR